MWMKVTDSKRSWQRLLRYYLTPKPERPRGGLDAADPVEPPSPKPLSGGAAAALEFDD